VPGSRVETAPKNFFFFFKQKTAYEIKVPLFIKEGEKVKVNTETGEFGGRA